MSYLTKRPALVAKILALHKKASRKRKVEEAPTPEECIRIPIEAGLPRELSHDEDVLPRFSANASVALAFIGDHESIETLLGLPRLDPELAIVYSRVKPRQEYVSAAGTTEAEGTLAEALENATASVLYVRVYGDFPPHFTFVHIPAGSHLLPLHADIVFVRSNHIARIDELVAAVGRLVLYPFMIVNTIGYRGDPVEESCGEVEVFQTRLAQCKAEPLFLPHFSKWGTRLTLFSNIAVDVVYVDELPSKMADLHAKVGFAFYSQKQGMRVA